MKSRGFSRNRRLACAIFVGAIVAALLAPAAGQASAGAKASIIGGKIASIADFPSLVFIDASDRRGRGFACTGTVIAPRVVLTAAHCVENLEAGGYTPARQYTVASGYANPHQAPDENLFKVQSTHVFPEFDPGTLHGDAGILILEFPATAQPIPLATSADAALYQGGETALLAGWGLRRADATAAPRRLRTTSTVVEDPKTCAKRTQRYYPVYSPGQQMCTTSPPPHVTGGCFGDSGGPALTQRPDGSLVEIGITSTGGPRCSTKLPNVFTRTDRLYSWATEWIAAVEAGGPPVTAKELPAKPLQLYTESAKEFVVGTLSHNFGLRFLRNRELRGRCQRATRERVRCSVAWLTGANLYLGTVSVFYLRKRDATIWDSHFAIRRVNYACWSRSSRRQTCATYTRRG